MNQQNRSRMIGEWQAAHVMVLLLCGVSIWRTAMTRILPLCGASAWWVALFCLLPGFAVAAVLRLVMWLHGVTTVTESIRVGLGKVGAVVFSVMLAALLLVEAVSALTALLTVFTQGVGTKGTQFTLALLTGTVLACSLKREGLPRGIYLLRWVVLSVAVLLGGFGLTKARLDGLFPLYGSGDSVILEAIRAGGSLAWPIVLLLTVPPCGQPRLYKGILPGVGVIAAMLIVTLMIPHEVLIRQAGLAGQLLLPTRYAPNALRVLWLCLLMLCFFFSTGTSVQLATKHLLAPWGNPPSWLPHVLLAGVILTQRADIPRLWAMLESLEPWLLLPLAGITIILLPIAFIRRKMS